VPCDERVFWTDLVANALEIAMLILVFVAIWRAGTLLRSLLHAVRRISRGDTRVDLPASRVFERIP
jgi:hypothetical protein